jgi:hypothetical protein
MGCYLCLLLKLLLLSQIRISGVCFLLIKMGIATIKIQGEGTLKFQCSDHVAR